MTQLDWEAYSPSTMEMLDPLEEETPNFTVDTYETMNGRTLDYGIYVHGNALVELPWTDENGDNVIEEWIVIGMEYEISFCEISLESECLGDFYDDWVWVDGDECIINETHCVHYVGGSETSNKDNNHQYDNACTKDLVARLESWTNARREISASDAWVFSVPTRITEEPSRLSIERTNRASAEAEGGGRRTIIGAITENPQGVQHEAMNVSRGEAMGLIGQVPIGVAEGGTSSMHEEGGSVEVAEDAADFAAVGMNVLEKEPPTFVRGMKLMDEENGSDEVVPVRATAGVAEPGTNFMDKKNRAPEVAKQAVDVSGVGINSIDEEDDDSIEVTVYAIKDGQGHLQIAIKDTKYSNNCAAQYKNRFSAMETAHANDLHENITRKVRFALKYCFKGNWDGEGKIFKYKVRTGELKGDRIHDAWLSYEYGKQTLTKTGLHKAWSNVSVCDDRYILSQEYSEDDHKAQCRMREEAYNKDSAMKEAEYEKRKQEGKDVIFHKDTPYEERFQYVKESSPQGGGYSHCSYTSYDDETLQGRTRYRKEGTGGPFSDDIVRRTPPGIVLCSDDSILEKRINSLDSRTFCFATCNLDRFFKLCSKSEHSDNIIYVDRREEVKPDPGEDAVKGIKMAYEMSGKESSEQLVPGEYGLALRGLYCSCSICRGDSGNRECQHLKGMGVMGVADTRQLKNSGQIEWFRCLCCGRRICSMEQALRHSVRKECPQLYAASWNNGDYTALRNIYETSMALCTDLNEDGFRTAVSLQFPFNSLSRVSYQLNIHPPTENSQNNSFGLNLQDHPSGKLPPYIKSIDQNSQFQQILSGNFRTNTWILSINGKETKSKKQVLDILNGESDVLDVDSLRASIKTIKETSRKKKADYINLAHRHKIVLKTSGKRVDDLRQQIEKYIAEYLQDVSKRKQFRIESFTMVISKMDAAAHEIQS